MMKHSDIDLSTRIGSGPDAAQWDWLAAADLEFLRLGFAKECA
jgi:hypothetical protein